MPREAQGGPYEPMKDVGVNSSHVQWATHYLGVLCLMFDQLLLGLLL